MSIIYLTSSIDEEFGFYDNIKKYLKEDLKGAKKLICISSTPDNYEKNDMYYNIYIKWFEEFGIKESVLLDSRYKDSVDKAINENDVVYLMGGDPFTQINYLKYNNIDKILNLYNGVIIGTSAGAMNLGKKVYYCKDEDYPKTTTYDGVGIVDITIDPHFDMNNEIQINEFKKYSEKFNIIGLPEESAIRIIKNEVIYIGENYNYEDF
jgi:Peptidase E